MSFRELLHKPEKRKRAYLTELFFQLSEDRVPNDFTKLLMIAAEESEEFANSHENDSKEKKKCLEISKLLRSVVNKW